MKETNTEKQFSGSTGFPVNREYKSDAFKMFFSIKKNALELYNALNGTDYGDENALEINTLDQAVYLKIYNDVSFTVSGTVNLYEHQSTVNPNMPLRDLFYVTDMYKSSVSMKDLYGKKMVKVPTPKFVVFYNGSQDMPDEEQIRLSDVFESNTDDPELELVVRVLNINFGHNKALLNKCLALKHYAILIERIRNNQKKGMAIEEAASEAIDWCISEHVMEDFLTKERAGVIAMHVLDFNEELHEKELLEEGIREGTSRIIANLMKQGKTAEDIAYLCGLPLTTVSDIVEELKKL